MNKQTEDKILEMLLHKVEKHTEAHPLDPQKDGVHRWIKRCGGSQSLRMSMCAHPLDPQKDGVHRWIKRCGGSQSLRMSMCNKCELQYCTDCIDTHACDNVTFL